MGNGEGGVLSELGIIVHCLMEDGSPVEVTWIDHGDTIRAGAWTTEIRIGDKVIFSHALKSEVKGYDALRSTIDIETLTALGVDAGSFLDAIGG